MNNIPQNMMINNSQDITINIPHNMTISISQNMINTSGEVEDMLASNGQKQKTMYK